MLHQGCGLPGHELFKQVHGRDDGVTLTIKEAKIPAFQQTLNVANDSATVAAAIQTFVSANKRRSRPIASYAAMMRYAVGRADARRYAADGIKASCADAQRRSDRRQRFPIRR